MAILNRIPDTSAFPNTNGTGMTMRQWYKGQILAGFNFPEMPYMPSKGDIRYYTKIIGQLADALIEEDNA
tara:strand:- start:88086 stop:88295 length:210 start_codon:yes stop_codon:yes gene_type:complete